MRSCLIQLLLLVLVAFLLLWVLLPIGAGLLAVSALNATGFTGTDTKVDVVSNPPPLLLTGHADTLRLRSTDAALRDLHASRIDVTFGDVSIFSRKVGTVHGTLDGVRVASPDGDPIAVEQVTVDGDAGAAQAALVVTKAEAERLAEARLKAVAGITATVTLQAPDRLTIDAGGGFTAGTLVVSGGALVLRPDNTGLPSVTLIVPGAGNPFELSAVAVDGNDLRLEGTIDIASMLS